MALPQGVYFRATDDQTDPANYYPDVQTTATYPDPTPQGQDVGWEQAPDGTRDRGGTGAVELRGMAFVVATPVSDYRIDLPATGEHNVRLAIGDEGSDQTALKVELIDDTTVFATPVDSGVLTLPAGDYIDASGVQRTSQADWTTNNAAISRTFASTIFRIRLGRAAGGATPLAAVYIEAVGGATVNRIRFPAQTSAMGVGGMLGGNRVH